LEGFRAVEMGVGVAGPLAGVYLVDMGVEVIKIEPPGGDGTRSFRGVANPLPADAPTPWQIAVNRGKKSFELDLSTPDGQEAAHRLIESSDVFLTNHRDGALRHMGMDYDTLSGVNPRLVYAVSSGFGIVGPDSGAAMLDIAVQARGGMCSMTGPADDVPMVVGTIVADAAAGMLFALAIVTALTSRERTGLGQRVDTSALGAQLFLQSCDINHSSITGNLLTRQGRHMQNIEGVTGLYATADRRGLVLGRIPPADWPDFCHFAGLDDLVDDPVWGNAVLRAGMGKADVDSSEFRCRVAAAVLKRPLAEWQAFLHERPNIVQGIAQTYEEVLDDPQVVANDYLAQFDIAGIGPRRIVGNVVRFGDTPASAKTTIAGTGAHTAELLESLGYGDEDIARFAAHLDAGYHRLAERAGYSEKELGAISGPTDRRETTRG
jgi:crotonobetainyl-CoA:carnitine CoA-transferase CaiB-like acyl-CoA transferase